MKPPSLERRLQQRMDDAKLHRHVQKTEGRVIRHELDKQQYKKLDHINDRLRCHGAAMRERFDDLEKTITRNDIFYKGIILGFLIVLLFAVL